MLHAFDGAIIEVEVRDLEPRGARNSRGIAPYRESMVLRGDKYLSGRKIAHGMVAAAMAVRELHGFAPKGEAEELVAEADAEDRHAAVGQVAQRRDRVAHGRRIAGAVREEHAVGRELPHPRAPGGGGDDGHATVVLHEQAQDVALHPVVVRHDVMARVRWALAVLRGDGGMGREIEP